MTESQKVITNSAEETVELGRRLASQLAPPKLVVLSGTLGAGKTTLVKGIVEGYAVGSREDVSSPTFTLVHEYRSPAVNLYHIDLYRVDTTRELETLGIDDLLGERSVIIIEWGEKFECFRQERDVKIAMERTGESQRKITIAF